MNRETTNKREAILSAANNLRWEVGDNLHDNLIESIYTNASRISGKAVTAPGEKIRFSWERNLDRLLTSRYLGFPVMFLILGIVFWLTVEGANVPSGLLASLLIDTLHPVIK